MFNFYVKQDHQRWGYSTVTHMEQPVYLAIWKDLNKNKRKEHKKKGWTIEMGRMVERFPFLLQAFAPSALRLYWMYFSLFFVCLSILDNILIISDHFLTFPDISWQVPDLKSTQGTQKYPKEPKRSQKYPKVPKITKKYSKVLKSTQKYPKISRNTQKQPKISKNTQKHPKVPKSMHYYSKVHKRT